MKSIVSVTYEMDDPETAAAELLDGITRTFTPAKNSVGILFCYSDMEIDKLAARVEEKAGFEIIGCTAIANMDERDGFHEMAVTLTVLSADDCLFATAASDPITPENVAESIGKACEEIRGKLGGDPETAFCDSSLQT